MAEDEPLPEPDRVEDAPHPRETRRLIGQEVAEKAILDAWGAGRLHHGWLIAGPRGVGKATLAYRFARARLAATDESGLFGAPEPPQSLDVDPEDPVARRIAAGAEPRLFTLRRSADPKTRKLFTVIRVDEVRALKNFFQLSAADGGWRAAIVDSADEMNPAAANALLKILEEPPERCLILLIAHAPARLLPTIRSRCRRLDLAPLAADPMAEALAAAGFEPGVESGALAALAGGSVGEAARLIAGDGPRLYERLVRLATAAPGMDRREMIAVAETCAGRDAAPVYDMTLGLFDKLVARLARAGALGASEAEAAEGEGALHLRLAPNERAARTWADFAAKASDKAARARAVNLDPVQTMLDIFIDFDAAARAIRARAA